MVAPLGCGLGKSLPIRYGSGIHRTLFMKFPLSVLLLSGTLTSMASAGVKFEKERLDLKVAAGDAPMVVKFPFTNDSTESVRVVEVLTTCGCLDAKADKKEYAAGEKGVITATFDFGSFTGEQEKAINVRTSGKENAEHRLIVGVTIPLVFVVEPDLLEWELGEEKKTKSFHVTVPHTEPINILTLAPSRDNFQYELVVKEPGRDYEIKLTPSSTDVPMLGVLKITTDCKIGKFQRQLAFFSISRPKPTAPAPGAAAAESAPARN